MEVKCARKVTTCLIDEITRKLPFAAAEQFRCNIKDGHINMPIDVLITGSWTIPQQFTIITSALKDLRKEVKAGALKEEIPWDELTFLSLKFLEKELSSINITKDRVIQSTEPLPITSKRVTQPPKPAKMKTDIGKATERPKVVRTSDQNTKAVPVRSQAPADAELIKRIHNVIYQRMNNGVPLYATPAHRYVKCDAVVCEFCSQMYKHLEITACSTFGHTQCNSVGWFPHVGIKLWKKLQRQHDAGSPFKPGTITKRKPEDLPRLSESAIFSTRLDPAESPKRRHVDEGSTQEDMEEDSSPLSKWSDQLAELDPLH